MRGFESKSNPGSGADFAAAAGKGGDGGSGHNRDGRLTIQVTLESDCVSVVSPEDASFASTTTSFPFLEPEDSDPLENKLDTPVASVPGMLTSFGCSSGSEDGGVNSITPQTPADDDDDNNDSGGSSPSGTEMPPKLKPAGQDSEESSDGDIERLRMDNVDNDDDVYRQDRPPVLQPMVLDKTESRSSPCSDLTNDSTIPALSKAPSFDSCNADDNEKATDSMDAISPAGSWHREGEDERETDKGDASGEFRASDFQSLSEPSSFDDTKAECTDAMKDKYTPVMVSGDWTIRGNNKDKETHPNVTISTDGNCAMDNAEMVLSQMSVDTMRLRNIPLGGGSSDGVKTRPVAAVTVEGSSSPQSTVSTKYNVNDANNALMRNVPPVPSQDAINEQNYIQMENLKAQNLLYNHVGSSPKSSTSSLCIGSGNNTRNMPPSSNSSNTVGMSVAASMVLNDSRLRYPSLSLSQTMQLQQQNVVSSYSDQSMVAVAAASTGIRCPSSTYCSSTSSALAPPPQPVATSYYPPIAAAAAAAQQHVVRSLPAAPVVNAPAAATPLSSSVCMPQKLSHFSQHQAAAAAAVLPTDCFLGHSIQSGSILAAAAADDGSKLRQYMDRIPQQHYAISNPFQHHHHSFPPSQNMQSNPPTVNQFVNPASSSRPPYFCQFSALPAANNQGQAAAAGYYYGYKNATAGSCLSQPGPADVIPAINTNFYMNPAYVPQAMFSGSGNSYFPTNSAAFIAASQQQVQMGMMGFPQPPNFQDSSAGFSSGGCVRGNAAASAAPIYYNCNYFSSPMMPGTRKF
ncbi:unnamed protein product [Soboliphyme baturini]|uniref:PAM2 domain-containing protein n=1 Tax=Soboliphyme baturini TaxID=241478 RepID=A0A183IW01_9BILA|nr:unnamed protein product [Soboliphyme baturini]